MRRPRSSRPKVRARRRRPSSRRWPAPSPRRRRKPRSRARATSSQPWRHRIRHRRQRRLRRKSRSLRSRRSARRRPCRTTTCWWSRPRSCATWWPRRAVTRSSASTPRPPDSTYSTTASWGCRWPWSPSGRGTCPSHPKTRRSTPRSSRRCSPTSASPRSVRTSSST